MPDSNQWDENMTHNDLDKIQKAITEFDDAFQKLTHVFHSTDGDCNEIMWIKQKPLRVISIPYLVVLYTKLSKHILYVITREQ